METSKQRNRSNWIWLISALAIAGILGIAAAVIGVLVWQSAVAERERAGMLRVIEARNVAAAKALQGRKTFLGSVTNWNAQAFSAGLRKIQVQDCPKDFAQSWVRYVNAVDRESDLIGSAVRLGLSAFSSLRGGPGDPFEEWAATDSAEAWREVRCILAKHGILLTDR